MKTPGAAAGVEGFELKLKLIGEAAALVLDPKAKLVDAG